MATLVIDDVLSSSAEHEIYSVRESEHSDLQPATCIRLKTENYLKQNIPQYNVYEYIGPHCKSQFEVYEKFSFAYYFINLRAVPISSYSSNLKVQETPWKFNCKFFSVNIDSVEILKKTKNYLHVKHNKSSAKTPTYINKTIQHWFYF